MKRSVVGLIYLIQGMQQAGLPVTERLAEIGISMDSLDPEAKIHIETEQQIQAYLAVDVEPELGLYIGQHYALSGYGPLLMCLMTANSVKDAILTGIQYQALTYLMGDLKLEISAQRVGLIYQPKHMDDEIGLFRAQSEISGTYKFLRDIYIMMGLSFQHFTVELPFAVPKDPARYADFIAYYGPDLHFGAPYAAFWTDQNILEIKLPGADPITHQVYAKQCEQEIAQLQLSDPASRLLQTIEDYLMLQRVHFPNLTELAQMLGMSERTLRHHLQQMGTSFKAIRESVLKTKATELLQQGQCSIEMIAERLGYSETAGFNHAFKRWYGMSPKQYQKLIFNTVQDH